MQAEEKVVAEFPFGDELGEIFVGRGDEANIGREGLASSHAFEGSFPQDAEDFNLRGEIDLTDFIEEKSAPLGLLEAADAAFKGSGEGAFFMAEKLTGEELGRERCAVDGDNFFLRAGAEFVNRMGG